MPEMLWITDDLRERKRDLGREREKEMIRRKRRKKRERKRCENGGKWKEWREWKGGEKEMKKEKERDGFPLASP